MTTLRAADVPDLYRALAARGYVVRSVAVVPTGDVESLPAVPVEACGLSDLLSALRCRGIVAASDREPLPTPGVPVARDSWMQRHGSALRLCGLAAIVVSVLVVACSATGCKRASQIPPRAAPVVAPSADTDECPGGVCTPPPRRAK